jgi:AAA+ ATPase superfamily predicted ATPase
VRRNYGKKMTGHKMNGRANEIDRLSKIGALKQSSIVVVHGRRCVGKTTLIEHVFQNRKMLKIEGVEGGSKARQIETALIMRDILMRLSI